MNKFLTSLLLLVGISLQAQLRFAVISDPHVLAPELVSGTYQDARLIEHSAELFDSALVRIQAANTDVLLIPGDLTNDSEQASHQYVHNKLAQLVANGVQVLVVPGNHDINDPSAVSTALTTQSQFATLYADCGYNAAVLRQPGDLSYMVYPNNAWAIICLNSTKVNGSQRASAGGLTETTLQWAEQAAATARATGRCVLAMMHHPIVEHFDQHAFFAPTYIANQEANYPTLQSLQERLRAAGISLVFTGHYHINSIQKTTTPTGELYDVLTGSLSSYQCPIRLGVLNADGSLQISTDNMLRYDNLARQRNQATAIGALHAIANQFYTKLQAVPATLQVMLNIPASATEMYNVMATYMLPSITDILNELSAGDEDTRTPDAYYQAGIQAYDNFLLYLCRDNAFIKAQLATLIKLSGYDLESIYQSMLYNFAGSTDNTIADGSLALTLSNAPTKLKETSVKARSQMQHLNGHWHIITPQATYSTNGARIRNN